MNKKIFVIFVFLFLSSFYLLYTSSKTFMPIRSIIKERSHVEALKIKYKIRNVVAFVFYGRKKTVSILFHYLDKNLKKNGGVLDKVIFAVHTDNVEDIKYLKDFLVDKNTVEYERVDFTAKTNYKKLFSVLHDDDVVFKIDDDTVFISNNAFESMLQEYLIGNNFVLSANVINHPVLSNVHAMHKAILPFNETETGKWIFLPNTEIDDTIARDCIKIERSWWKNGRCAAIAHESFLHHIANERINIYEFYLWDFNAVDYGRWSINFIVLWGKYLNKLSVTHSHIASDEVIISIEIPKSMKKHSCALGSALVAHYSYFTQHKYIAKTNILEKYFNLSISYLKLSH